MLIDGLVSRYFDTETDGSIFVCIDMLSLSKTLSALLQSTQLINAYQITPTSNGTLDQGNELSAKIVFKDEYIC